MRIVEAIITSALPFVRLISVSRSSALFLALSAHRLARVFFDLSHVFDTRPRNAADHQAVQAGRGGPEGWIAGGGSEDFIPSNKKAGISADLVCWRSLNNARSVPRDDRAAVIAEAVVHAQSEHVHVLRDPVVHKSRKSGRGRERIIAVPHEQMVVLNTG